MTPEEFYRELSTKIDRVFKTHPQLTDHRIERPGLIGALGDPFSGIWFVGVYPSQTRVDSLPKRTDFPLTADEAQWSVSLGDKLLRKMLVKHGFKSGTVESRGGWNCYLTNVIKQLVRAGTWNKKPPREQQLIAETWYPVLRWELETSRPRLIVAMGKQATKLLAYLKDTHALKLPRIEEIESYVYVASRPRGNQPPGHPQRIQEYDDEFARIARILRELS